MPALDVSGMIEFLRELVRVRSVSDVGESAAAFLVAARMRALLDRGRRPLRPSRVTLS
jgi:acetylornithine deacetylase/succinyl-diaminopimelate desuccinylase-like protein